MSQEAANSPGISSRGFIKKKKSHAGEDLKSQTASPLQYIDRKKLILSMPGKQQEEM